MGLVFWLVVDVGGLGGEVATSLEEPPQPESPTIKIPATAAQANLFNIFPYWFINSSEPEVQETAPVSLQVMY